MATWKKFEEMEAWKVARQLVNATYKATRNGEFSRDFALKDQIRRAAISSMSNIAEGYERGGNAEFINFLLIAKGSAGEVRSQLYIALDEHYISDREFEAVKSLCVSTSRLIAGLVDYLKRTSIKGHRYKEATAPSARRPKGRGRSHIRLNRSRRSHR